MSKISYCMRIDKILLDKIKYIAKMENRSVNREIIWLIKMYVASYEKQCGQIKDEES